MTDKNVHSMCMNERPGLRSGVPKLQVCSVLHQGAFPARLKKVLIVGAPVWFRVPYNLLSLLLKEKLRERVSAVVLFSLWAESYLQKQASSPTLTIKKV